METEKKKNSQIQRIDWWLPDWGLSEMGEGSQNVQTSRYNINKSWDIMYTIHHGDCRFIFFKISLQFN